MQGVNQITCKCKFIRIHDVDEMHDRWIRLLIIRLDQSFNKCTYVKEIQVPLNCYTSYNY